ncbi:hypothetical protein ES708_33843 [subsurface metagenome]
MANNESTWRNYFSDRSFKGRCKQAGLLALIPISVLGLPFTLAYCKIRRLQLRYRTLGDMIGTFDGIVFGLLYWGFCYLWYFRRIIKIEKPILKW